MHNIMKKLTTLLALSLLALNIPAYADVTISDAWVRANAPGQTVGAAYMTLSSPQNSTLVSVESPVASSVEIHSMSMQNGVMKMRHLDALPIQAGKPAKLAPGGFHLMLFDLNGPLKAGDQVTFKLHFKDSDNHPSEQTIRLPVKDE